MYYLLSRLFGYLARRADRIPRGEPVSGPFPRFRAFFRNHYMRVDTRTAGIFRLALGFLLILDTFRHSGEARLLYSNSGVLTNDFHMWQPTSGYEFSVFHAFSTLDEVKVCFALGILSHFFLFVGYRSRLFAFLSFVFTTSMDSRIPFVENGGYIVVNLACLWAIFLPIERRFSIDAWLKSWRMRRERAIAELNDRTDFTGERQPVVSLIGLMVVVNIGIIYFWNVINKNGDIWRWGHTVHFVLHIERMITGLAVASRDILPEWLLSFMDWAVLCVESMLCILILSPKAKRYTRPIAIVGMTLLHSSFGFMMRLGPFSWFMIVCSTLLLTPIQFADIKRWYEKRAPSWEVGLDESSPLALAIGRILMRLDGYERLRFEPYAGNALLAIRAPATESESETESATGSTREWLTSPSAVVRGLVQALPLGRYAYPLVSVFTLGTLPRLLAIVSKRRAGVARFFAIGGPGPIVTEPTPLRAIFLGEVGALRELFLVWLAVASIVQSYMENKAIPQIYKPAETPSYVQATINYPRLFQGWGMFAPNPIQEDGVLVIDAYTIDGRRIDPYNGGGEPMLDLTTAHGLGISQLRQDYGNRIRLDHNQRYRDGMREWLSHWPEVTGNPNDEIVAFDVYWVRDKCPPVGATKPTDNDAVPIYSWRKPGYRRPHGMPPIPPVPKARTAERWEDMPTPPRDATRPK